MKKIFFATIVAAVLVGFMSCGGGKKTKNQDNTVIDAAHNSRNSVEWYGTYTGTIPCADCEGINVQITLNEDETYQASYVYLGKDNDVPSTFSGKFVWSEDGGSIALDSKYLPPYYKVGENRLFQLDLEGNSITGELADMYVLTKKFE